MNEATNENSEKQKKENETNSERFINSLNFSLIKFNLQYWKELNECERNSYGRH